MGKSQDINEASVKTNSFEISKKVNQNISLAGSFTIDLLLPGLKFWLNKLNFHCNLQFTDYNQLFQEFLNPNGILRSNKDGFNVILFRSEDWLHYFEEHKKLVINNQHHNKETIKHFQKILKDFKKSLHHYYHHLPCHTLFIICPISPIYRENEIWSRVFSNAEKKIVKVIERWHNFSVIKSSDYHSLYKIYHHHEPFKDSVAHIPYDSNYFHFLSTLIIRHLYSITNKPYKVFALDCDNTLWGGVCAEKGADNVEISERFNKFQDFLITQKKQGMLLTLVSKNKDDDVWSVFKENKNLLLRKDDIVDARINWQKKSWNIRSLSKSLNLGTDSFIFIDDNPIELAEVKSEIPEVFSFSFPNNLQELDNYLKHIWIFDHLSITKEDRERTLLYQANKKREAFKQEQSSFKDFLDKLQLKVQINKISAKTIERIAQLSNRTNQFNSTTIQRNSSQIRNLIENDGYDCLVVNVEDRFGKYGIVGGVFYKEESDFLFVDSFLLSCRVLGRGVEHKIIRRLSYVAEDKKLDKIRFDYRKTKKNEPVRNFLERIGKSYRQCHKNHIEYIIPVKELKNVKFDLDESTQISQKMKTTSLIIDNKIREKEKLLFHIAKDLSDIQSISLCIENFEKTNNKQNKNDLSSDNIKKFKKIKSCSLEERIVEKVTQIYSRHIKSSKIKICKETLISDLDLDSLSVIDIAAEINKEFGEVPVTLFFESNSIGEICQYLLKNHQDSTLNNLGKKTDNINPHPALKISKDRKYTDEKDQDIAIIGINCRYPGSKNISEFWKNLTEGNTFIKEVPESRWKADKYFDGKGDKLNCAYSKWGGFLDSIECFEAKFFNISPREAEMMDPQQRIYLEIVWGLMEDAGYTPENMPRKTGVFTGAVNTDYRIHAHIASLSGKSTYPYADLYQIANRISYFMNFTGPSFTVDSACSASGTALYLAYESLVNKECENAIVGGISLISDPAKYIQFSQKEFLSPNNKCSPFSENADGMVLGEGAGAVLLKPVKKAREDNDHIYGIIKGISINSGGHTNGFTVPNPKAQSEVVVKALEKADVDCRTISYIEAHGTGTKLGDPIEVRGLTKAFESNSENKKPGISKQFCAVGSIKSSIGHSESAACMAGLIKILLQLKHKKLVPTVNSDPLNHLIDFKASPFYVQQTFSSWEKPKIRINSHLEKFPRRAGLSSFGAGGSNAHIIIEEYEASKKNKAVYRLQEGIFVLSARTDDILIKYVKNIILYLENMEKNNFAPEIFHRFLYTFQTGRKKYEKRIAILCKNFGELFNKLKLYLNNSDSNQVIKNDLSSATDTREPLQQIELNQLIYEKKSNKIAKLWINGNTINWGLLYEKCLPQKMSLPTYPFSGDKFWISDKKFYGDNIKLVKTSPENTSKPFYLKENWELNSEFNSQNLYLKTSLLLLFGGDEFPFTEFEKLMLRANNQQYNIIRVFEGKEFNVLSKSVCKIDPENENDIIRLFEWLIQKGYNEVSVLYLWPIYPKSNYLETIQYEPSLEHLHFIFNLIKSNLKVNLKIKNINYIFNYFQTDELSLPCVHAGTGFYPLINLIYPGINFKSIMIKPNVKNNDSISKILFKELQEKTLRGEIYYQNNSRYLKNYQFVEIKSNAPNIKKKGLYLVTGGLGALGKIFAEYLSVHYNAKIVLLGRTKLSRDKKREFEKLKLLNKDICYFAVDISNLKSLQSVIHTVKDKYGELNGIIHAAGVMDKKRFEIKTLKEVDEVLKPKVKGVWVLDKVTKNINLDFFLVFSSLSSILGDFGQGDYTLANRYLDCFIDYREQLRAQGLRQGQSISINWPLWKNGGMHLDDTGEKLYLKTSGLTYLNNKEGIRAFETILGSNLNKIVVISGKKAQVNSIFTKHLSENQYDFKNQIEKTGANENHSDLDSLNQKITKSIRQIIKDLLFLKEENISNQESLGELGFDSITLKSFSETLGNMVGIKLSPTIFFSYSNITKLSKYLIDNYNEEILNNINLNCTGEHGVGNSLIKENNVTNHRQNLGQINEVAIVGMSAILPGSKDVNAFWNNIIENKDLIREIPKHRWNYHEFARSIFQNENSETLKWLGSIQDEDKFDPRFFNITPGEAILMDPQHRLFLETVWKTIEDAGYQASKLKGRKIGVIVGMQHKDYANLIARKRVFRAFANTGNEHSMLPNRISYFFDLKGPSETIDTACSSSLVAIHRAMESIRSGESEMAICGGVSLILSPENIYGTSRLGILSPDGRCKTLSDQANGYVKGEGICAILIKPLKKAEKDRDHVYAVLKSSGVNHGGKANSLTAPNPESQAELLYDTYSKADINPEHVTHIEMHGTGTELGDPIEIEGLITAFKRLANNKNIRDFKKSYCALSTIKNNIGHLEPAAGIAGVIKLIYCLKNKMIPGLIHFNQQNKYIKLSGSPFYIARENIKWDQLKDKGGDPVKRIGGVSSFGYGGTNAHVVLEEYNKDIILTPSNREKRIFVLSAKSKKQLRKYLQEIIRYLNRFTKTLSKAKDNIIERPGFRDFIYTLQTGREAMNHRIALPVNNFNELYMILSGFDLLNGEMPLQGYKKVGISSNSHITQNNVISYKETVKNLYYNNQVEKVCELWLEGHEIPWEELYIDPLPRRISLPTYPFEKKRYWIDDQRVTNSNNRKLDPPKLETPFIKNKNIYKVILKKDDPLIMDHLVDNRKILSGVYQLEIVYNIFRQLFKKKYVKLKDIFWHSPIEIQNNNETIEIKLMKESDNVYFELSKKNENGKAIVNSSGTIELTSHNFIQRNEIIDVDKIINRCPQKIEGEKCYEKFQKYGLKYGKSFKGIHSIFFNHQEAFSFLSVNHDLFDIKFDFFLHPTIFDGALQSIISLNENLDIFQPGLINVPFSIGEILVYGNLPKVCYAHVMFDTYEPIKKIFFFNYKIFNKLGVLLLEIKKFSLKKTDLIKQKTIKKISSTLNSKFIYIPTWKEIKEKPKIKSVNGNILLFYTKQGKDLVEKFKNTIRENLKTKPILVEIGNRNGILKRNQWRIQSNSKSSIRNLLSKVMDIGMIYFFAISDIHEFSNNVEKNYKVNEKNGILTIFQMVKEITINHITTDKLPITVITNNNYLFNINETINPVHSALSGFCCSADKENSEIEIRYVDIDIKETVSDVDIVLLTIYKEINYKSGEIVVLRNGRRYREYLESIKKYESEILPFRKRGVYIILGGAGGIGQQICRFLCKKNNAKVILIGRSKLTKKKKQVLIDKKKRGHDIYYVQADAEKKEELAHAIERVRKAFGKINGVFHSALVLEDKTIFGMTEDCLKRVLAPKTRGAISLYNIVKNDQLDFFCFFSSVQSFVCNPGQSNYAAACTFKDSFAKYMGQKLSYPIKIINWGYWGTVGVVSTEEFNLRLKKQGFYSIDPEEGIKAVIQAISLPYNQIVAIKASQNALDKINGEFESYDIENEYDIPSMIEKNIQKEETPETNLINYLNFART